MRSAAQRLKDPSKNERGMLTLAFVEYVVRSVLI